MANDTAKTFLSLRTTTSDKINDLAIKNGQMIFVYDTNRLAFDYKDERAYYSQIITKTGDVTSPITLSDLDEGIYSISGHYKIGGKLETIFVTPQKITFLISSDGISKNIVKLDAKNFELYTVDTTTNEVTTDMYATQSWILSQGYTTKDYVSQAIDQLYERIIKELKVPTKLSELENDAGYVKGTDLTKINGNEITTLFNGN